jgi:hypothetical protein
VSLLANAYKHCLNEVVMRAPTVAMAAAASLKAIVPTTEAAADPKIDGDTAQHVWTMVQTRIASHMINNYQARIEAKCKEEA